MRRLNDCSEPIRHAFGLASNSVFERFGLPWYLRPREVRSDIRSLVRLSTNIALAVRDELQPFDAEDPTW